MIKKYTWCKNKDEEYSNNLTFDTVEECIANAKIYYECSCLDNVIYIAETEPYRFSISEDNTHDILEELIETSVMECGKVAKSWGIRHLNCDEIEDLKNVINNSVKSWIKHKDKEPDFYKLNIIQEVVISKKEITSEKRFRLKFPNKKNNPYFNLEKNTGEFIITGSFETGSYKTIFTESDIPELQQKFPEINFDALEREYI